MRTDCEIKLEGCGHFVMMTGRRTVRMLKHVVVLLIVVALGACVEGAPVEEVEDAAVLVDTFQPPAPLRIRLNVYNSAPERVDGCATDLGLMRGRDNWHDAYPVYQVACEDGAAIYEVPAEEVHFWFLDELPRVIGPEFELVPGEVRKVLRVSVRLPAGWHP
jgi:hypothetical protein